MFMFRPIVRIEHVRIPTTQREQDDVRLDEWASVTMTKSRAWSTSGITDVKELPRKEAGKGTIDLTDHASFKTWRIGRRDGPRLPSRIETQVRDSYWPKLKKEADRADDN
ncbi:uncharacterized protein LOC112494558 isoform X2 [Cephus cinctus]|uniref:Uncharacterized protein LOC112494558 isoform X2 n=1 Tax=Cephus cinctus TaxID=211228 RepID=A0AAJ7W2K8_CEPCN|nr:uncharacterized protein LOC112494558 isoform X2 [Cephus cinctus]